jgi:hypothetical protein
MALNISFHNIPHAFGHITELAQLPNESTYDVIFNNKTIDQAVANVPDMLGDDYWDLQDTDSDPMFSDSGRFPDVIDQAIYQTENPNAVLTPWGPALDPMEVSNIMEDYFGADSLVGMDASETQALFDEADAIIDNNGEQLDEIVNQADATAMAENLNANDVAINLFDEIASQGTAIPTPLTSPVPGAMDEGGLSLFDRLTGLQSAEAGTNEVPVTDTQGIGDRPSMYSPLYEWEYGDYDPVTGMRKEPGDIGYTEESPGGRWASGALGQQGNAEVYEILSGLLVPDPDDNYGATDAEILEEINSLLYDPDSVMTIDDLERWATGLGAEYSGLASKVSDIAEAFDARATTFGPTDTVDGSINIGGADDWMQGADAAGTGVLANVPETMNRVFFNTLDNTIDQASGRPLSTLSQYYNNRTSMLNETQALFWLWGMDDPRVDRAHNNPEFIAGRYQEFLNQYLTDPRQFTSGPELDAKIQALRTKLSGPESQIGTIYGDYFGVSPAESGREKMLTTLMQIYNTGSSFRGGGRQNTLNAVVNNALIQGDDIATIFIDQTQPRAGATDTPQEGQQLDLFPSDTVTTGTPAQPFQYDRTGLRDPALSFSPELYSPGTQRFGVPGETMAMRYQRFREDPLVPRPMVYDRTGMRDPSESLTSEFLGGKRDTFVDDQAWRDDPMIIPGINAAALPPQGPEDLNQADVDAYYASTRPWSNMPVSEHMYAEAMAQLKAARDAEGEQRQGGTVYKPSESTVAVTGIAPETIASMPTPFNEEQAERLAKGLPYRQGRWTGGTKAQFDRLSARDKRAIMAGDLWVAGTTFVPTKGYTR